MIEGKINFRILDSVGLLKFDIQLKGVSKNSAARFTGEEAFARGSRDAASLPNEIDSNADSRVKSKELACMRMRRPTLMRLLLRVLNSSIPL
ncbi:MAG: hypothetical protein ABSE00_02025 [Chitinispirillaceae bacterium]|jgi:hypothetical protein